MSQEGTNQNFGSYNYYDNATPTGGSDFNGADGGMAYPGVWGQQDYNQNYTYPSQYSAPTQTSSTGLYKTKLCRHFQTKGHCNMGEKCNFAHGMEELRASAGGAPAMPTSAYSFAYTQPTYQSNYTNTDHSGSKYYKTVLCRNFQETGQCQFGDNCKFAHGDAELRAPAATGYKSTNYYSYGAGAGYGAFAPPPQPSGATPYYGYDMNYAGYQGGEPMPASYDISGSTAPVDPSQNYSYSYGTDQNYYQGFEGYDANKMGGGMPVAAGKDTNSQYYSQSQMPPTGAYMGEGQDHYHQ